MLRRTVHGQEPQARADDLEGLGSEATMHVVPVGLRFGVAPFLWRSEDRAPADVLLLPLLRVRGECLYLPQENRRSYSTSLELGEFFAGRLN